MPVPFVFGTHTVQILNRKVTLNTCTVQRVYWRLSIRRIRNRAEDANIQISRQQYWNILLCQKIRIQPDCNTADLITGFIHQPSSGNTWIRIVQYNETEYLMLVNENVYVEYMYWNRESLGICGCHRWVYYQRLWSVPTMLVPQFLLWCLPIPCGSILISHFLVNRLKFCVRVADTLSGQHFFKCADDDTDIDEHVESIFKYLLLHYEG